MTMEFWLEICAVWKQACASAWNPLFSRYHYNWTTTFHEHKIHCCHFL